MLNTLYTIEQEILLHLLFLSIWSLILIIICTFLATFIISKTAIRQSKNKPKGTEHAKKHQNTSTRK